MPALPNAPSRSPKVDPGDLLFLFLRFITANFVMFAAAYCLLRHYIVLACILGILSAMTQRAAIILFRRMRAEYVAALEEIERSTEVQAHAS